MFAPLLKTEHTVPFDLGRLCDGCGELSLFVRTDKSFFVVCRNARCPKANQRRYIPCFLRHRKYPVTRMSLRVEGSLALTREGAPDFDNPEYNPSLIDGPHIDCEGVLDWDPDQPAKLDTWLRCTVCGASYHALLFATMGLIGAQLHFSNFRIKVNRDGNREVVSNWGSGDKVFAFDAESRGACFGITEVRWLGQRIVTTQPL